jgi:UDP-N-acetyl-D-mannosaminuronic acid transferase (WecB/TagA/CpsF family)
MPVPWFFSRWWGEWLYRLYKNPKKHSKRIWRVLKFLYLCIQTNNN